MKEDYLQSVRKQFEYYQMLGEKTIGQVPAEKLFWRPNGESNSIAIIVKHLWGNMMSRWTDFLNSDGEKDWRDRDAEFEADSKTKDDLLKKWVEGWDCLYHAIDSLHPGDLEKIIYIRNMGHTVVEALNRQLSHYSYHVGQIVFLGKMIQGEKWQSLSIPKGESVDYNKDKFSRPKQKEHFTREFLDG